MHLLGSEAQDPATAHLRPIERLRRKPNEKRLTVSGRLAMMLLTRDESRKSSFHVPTIRCYLKLSPDTTQNSALALTHFSGHGPLDTAPDAPDRLASGQMRLTRSHLIWDRPRRAAAVVGCFPRSGTKELASFLPRTSRYTIRSMCLPADNDSA